MDKKHKKTVSLVLGSGGARGLAHIGIIRWLEENGFEIRSVAGCSIGSLVGGVYAAGKLDELEEWMRAISRFDMFGLLDFSWQTSGLIKGEKLIRALSGLIGDQQIEALPIPFTAIATDIKNEKEVWVNKGSLFDAIRASISIPFFFTPFSWKGIQLVDGGVLNPVPIAPTFSDGTDVTIAVNLGGPRENPEKLAALGVSPADEETSFFDRFDFFSKGEDAQSKNEDWGVYDIFLHAFDAMQNSIARQKLAAYPPDIIIEIPRNACEMLEFDRSAEMIELGYRVAQQDGALQELK